MRNKTERGVPGKLRPYWEKEIYFVTMKRNDIPVDEVKPETEIGRSSVLHRNMLLSCSYLAVETQLKPSKDLQAGSKRASKQKSSREETSIATAEDIGSSKDDLRCHGQVSVRPRFATGMYVNT